MTENAIPELVGIKELARRWRVSEATVRRRLKEGKLKGLRLGGVGSLRFDVNAILNDPINFKGVHDDVK